MAMTSRFKENSKKKPAIRSLAQDREHLDTYVHYNQKKPNKRNRK